jgi:hypothetical protein
MIVPINPAGCHVARQACSQAAAGAAEGSSITLVPLPAGGSGRRSAGVLARQRRRRRGGSGGGGGGTPHDGMLLAYVECRFSY